MALLEVLNPVAQQRGVINARPITKRPTSLEGKTVGLLWSGTAMGDVALRRVEEMLKQRLGDKVRTKFYVGGLPAPQHVLDAAGSECDVVIGATAD